MQLETSKDCVAVLILTIAGLIQGFFLVQLFQEPADFSIGWNMQKNYESVQKVASFCFLANSD